MFGWSPVASTEKEPLLMVESVKLPLAGVVVNTAEVAAGLVVAPMSVAVVGLVVVPEMQV